MTIVRQHATRIVAMLGILVLAAVAPVSANIIAETEPNDSYLVASPLIGNNNLGAFGTLNADGPGGDPAEVFSFTVLSAGNVRGTDHVATPLTSPNGVRVRFLDAAGTPLFISGEIGEVTPGQSATWDWAAPAPGLYYVSLQRSGFSIPEPSLDWDLGLQGFNAAPAGQPSNAAVIASGPLTVPEPGTFALLVSGLLPLMGEAFRRCRAHQSRRRR